MSGSSDSHTTIRRVNGGQVNIKKIHSGIWDKQTSRRLGNSGSSSPPPLGIFYGIEAGPKAFLEGGNDKFSSPDVGATSHTSGVSIEWSVDKG